ncbi:ShlB/FhaC/HecB family hemolysin secretion/activation protein [Pseudoduganella rivuli]|uniref:ShlB/FhaC/HecB family hemolysin secretion/activation protein n=1 Tax=Pseudoduganella rivuli TaxID=2666085 RepID=UPI001E623508|nr:ShlB/FhaC/HecB family hemolysin secretion/activation protein [Pseudoduganella rivuli]
MTTRLPAACFALVLASAWAGAQAEEQRFDITRFDVVGNTLLPDAQVQALLAPYRGPQRNFADVQRALDALENAYRAAGYGAVQVALPEQEATSGAVRFDVMEAKIGKITVLDNRHYSADNVRRGLPALQPGASPNLRRLSENVQLSNENGAKQVEVSLAAGDNDDIVDANVRVTDRSPHQGGLSADNTGTDATGKWRTGVFYQYANLFDRDHAVSLAYTTSPDSPAGVKIHNYSIGYRVPLYGWGDSIDVIYGKSSSNTPSSTPTLGGALNIVGKGDVVSVRLNHNFPRAGETTRKLVAALDYKAIDARCTAVDGTPVSTAPPTPPLASCVPYTVMPLSVQYMTSTRSGMAQTDASVGLAVNLPRGVDYTNITGRSDRYSYLTSGNRDTRDRLVILRGAASWFRGWHNDWQTRVAGSVQYALQPLVSAESFGLTGANSVRGFDERVLSADSGVIANAELYAPDLAAVLGWDGSLRLLAFVDGSHGHNRAAQLPVAASVSAASAGIGLRAALGKSVTIRVDVARVLEAGRAPGVARGDHRAHIFLTVGY